MELLDLINNGSKVVFMGGFALIIINLLSMSFRSCIVPISLWEGTRSATTQRMHFVFGGVQVLCMASTGTPNIMRLSPSNFKTP